MREPMSRISTKAPSRFGLPRAAIMAMAGAVALALLIATPARSLGLGFLEAFEAQRVVPLALTPDDLRQLKFLPNFDDFGTSRTLTAPGRSLDTTDFGQAARWSGLSLRAPAYLPAGVSPTTQNVVMPVSAAAFTFDRRKAMATARAHGYVLPAMPAGLDGSTLQLTFGPTVVTLVGDGARLVGMGSSDEASSGSGSSADDAKMHGVHFHVGNVSTNRISNVFILQSATPKIASTGASAATIEGYLLAQPGISPRLAAAIQALGNPATTLPIPIPVNQAYETAVTIHGLPGVAVGDNTGIGSVVIWQERGILTAIGGTLPLAEVGRIAESMR
jgi:hypothetical protein